MSSIDTDNQPTQNNDLRNRSSRRTTQPTTATMPTRQQQAPASNRGNNTRERSTQASNTTVTPAANRASAPARGTSSLGNFDPFIQGVNAPATMMALYDLPSTGRGRGTHRATSVVPNMGSTKDYTYPEADTPTSIPQIAAATTPTADNNWEEEAPWLFGNVADTSRETLSPMEQIAKDKSTPTRSVSVTDNGTNFSVTDTTPVTTNKGITDYTGGRKSSNPFTSKPTWMRQVPIWLSGLAALRGELTPADYSNADAITAAAYQVGQPVSVGTEYIGDYRKRDPFDTHYLENIINQRGAAADRNMMNLSGGNRAVGMAGILANDLVTQQGLAEAARQGYIANRTDDAQVSEFNRGTNLANMQAQNARNLALAQLNSQRQNAMLSGIAQGARLRQAIKDQRDAAISANLTNFAQGLGDWGKENGFYNMLGGLNEEGILKYFFGDNYKTRFNNTSNE
jgi:hypothetical protein